MVTVHTITHTHACTHLRRKTKVKGKKKTFQVCSVPFGVSQLCLGLSCKSWDNANAGCCQGRAATASNREEVCVR